MAYRNAFFQFACVTVTIIWFVSGLYIFTNGFLLSRREIDIKSSCHNDVALSNSNFTNTCWTLSSVSGTYKRVVLIFIDALRYDFAFYQSDKPVDLPYINKLKIFKDLANEHGCQSTRLFRFHADAPTTTMQRLKAMTTGSFPTFIDISNNFDSSEITEDNLIDKIVNEAKENITFLGDDTWVKLFPKRFTTSYSFPSFDVKDLHLVDNGIIEHLVPELQKSNWKVLIAHFLGVDHCGHRHGPLHVEMSLKLKQMDAVLRSVVDTLDDDTLLLVMGDHGMTQTGDHGGETADEVESALFAFSRSAEFSQTDWLKSENCEAGSVQQIDIVPTLSLLLGNPIPFSNLGSIIVDLIPDQPQSALRDALLLNAKQMESYLKEYSTRYKNFNSPKFLQLIDSLAQLEKTNLNSLEILQLLHTVRDFCKGLWASFDEKLMVLGCCLFCTMCIMLFYQDFNAILLLLFTTVCFVPYLFAAHYQVSVLFLAFAILLLHIFYSFARGRFTVVGLLCTLFPLLYTSNSFVINEDAIVVYLYSSIVCLFCLNAVQQSYTGVAQKQFSKAKKVQRQVFKFRLLFVHWLRKPLGKLTLLVLLLIVSLRISFLFRTCRPEQFWCLKDTEQLAKDSNSLSSKAGVYYLDEVIDFSDPWVRLFVSGGSLVALFSLLTMRLKQEGNMRSPYSAPVICGTKLLPAATLFIVANWQLHTVSSEVLDSLPGYFVTFLPRCAYLSLSLSLLWWLVHPRTVHLMYRDKYGRFRDQLTLSETELVSYYYNQMKHQHDVEESAQQRRKNGSGSEDRISNAPSVGTPAAFGLYTLLSAALTGLGTVLLLLGAMLLEERYAPVLLLFVLSTWTLLEVISAVTHRRNDNSLYVPWDVVGLWMMSSCFWWFATGHQASISSIPWNAAFVGFQGSHPTVALPAMMVGANVFLSQILHTVLLPLLMLWPITRGSWFSMQADATEKATTNITSEWNLLQSPMLWSCLTDLFYKHLLMHALKVLGCVVAAFMHRRHLMVWQIFAPRFVYEVLSFLVISGTTLLVYMFLALVMRSICLWVKKENVNI